MQFTKVFITVVASAIAASAIPQYTSVSSAAEPAASPAPCTAGSAQCCSTVTTPGNATETFGEGILDGILGALAAPLVALGCSAIPIAGGECTDTPVCCAPETITEGLINIGCIPIGASL